MMTMELIAMERIETLSNIFNENIRQIIMYRRVASQAAYMDCVFETFENADDEMKEYLRLFDVDSRTKFYIFVEGIIKGIELSCRK